MCSIEAHFYSEELPHTKKQTKKIGFFYWIDILKVTAFKTKRNYTQVTLHTLPTYLLSLQYLSSLYL